MSVPRCQLQLVLSSLSCYIVFFSIPSQGSDYYHLLFVSWWSFTKVWETATPLVSRTLLSILAVLNNVVVWMVSTRSLISKSNSPFNKPLVTVPKAPITIDIIVTFMFYIFFDSQVRPKYLSLFSFSFKFILWVTASYFRSPWHFIVF